MVVAEVLTGIALVQQSVKFIKENISTAQDIGQIAGQIDSLLTGEKQVQEQRAKKSGAGIGDQFGINKVAQEVIDARLAQEKINEMRTLVDMRFGPGTWQSIVDERARRIQEAKEQAAQARKEQRLKQQELEEAIKTTLLIGGVILVAVALFAFLMVTVAWAAGY
jgi:hypothetical protein|tara:strand:+ start:247 stop:741 length:495 start_codon:yes stop_codon:yes gene_type:complete